MPHLGVIVARAREMQMTQQSPTQPIQNPLTLVMTAKSSPDYAALQQIITEIQSLPPDKNPITTALNNLANVHFARFVFLDNNQLAVITTYPNTLKPIRPHNATIRLTQQVR
jgi:hypothetical protein